MWLADILTECAWEAARSRHSYPGAQFWRLARRIGKKKAAIAVGHSILVIAWHLLTEDSDHEDLDSDNLTRRDAVRSRAISQLEATGYRVTLDPCGQRTSTLLAGTPASRPLRDQRSRSLVAPVNSLEERPGR